MLTRLVAVDYTNAAIVSIGGLMFPNEQLFEVDNNSRIGGSSTGYAYYRILLSLPFESRYTLDSLEYSEERKH